MSDGVLEYDPTDPNFTGLAPESVESRADWQSHLIELPPFSAEDQVEERYFNIPLPFVHNEDQMRTNSCSGHGGSTSAEVAISGDGALPVQLSRWGLYILGQKRCGLFGRDVGATLRGVFDALRLDGVPEESAWPFPGRYDTRIPAGALENAAQRKMTHFLNVERGGYDACRTVIGQNIGAVVFACRWPLTISQGNRIETYRPTGRGGHCMSWAALSTIKDARGRPYLIGPNSHLGLPYLLWAPAAVQAVLDQDEWGSFGITRMTDPQPREVDYVGENNPFRPE